MSLSADRLWSADQQVWLGALGHTVYLPADWPTEAGQPAVDDSDPAGIAHPVPTRAAMPSTAAEPVRRNRVPPERDEAPRERPAAPPRAVGSRLPDRLHFALIRASGCNPNAPGAAEIFAQWPPSAQLRGNPAAKRALWPALRKLRRSSLP